MARVAIIYSAAIFRERRLTESVSHFFLFQLKSIKNYKFRGTPLALLVWQGSPGFLVSIRTCILSRWAPIPNTFSTCPHICDIQPALDVTRNYCLGLIKPLKPSIWSDGLENPLTSPKTRLNFLSHSTTSSTFLLFDLESLMNVPLYHPRRSYYLFLNYPSWQRISKSFRYHYHLVISKPPITNVKQHWIKYFQDIETNQEFWRREKHYIQKSPSDCEWSSMCKWVDKHSVF